MKKQMLFWFLLLIPYFTLAQNNVGMRMNQQNAMNQNMLRKMYAPQKIDFQKMVKREEARIEKLESENIKLNQELDELKSKLDVSDDSKKEKVTKKIEKLQKKIEENNGQIANSKLFVLSYKKE
jgi:peptidoglycan hydrolase CwlO-like protein